MYEKSIISFSCILSWLICPSIIPLVNPLAQLTINNAVIKPRVYDKRKTYRHNHPTPGGSKFCFMVPQHATCKTNRTRDRLSMDIIQLKSSSALRNLWDSIRRCRAQYCNKLRPKTDCHLEPNFENTRAHTAQGVPWGYEQTRAV